jgi:methylenetetrahydrofolate dehydrogenase (NADP+)/methenyltetrahydrofolate cyclohydrolase
VPAKIIDGKAVADEITKQVKADVAAMKAAGRPPHLVSIQVGANPAGVIYARMQERSCRSVGIDYARLELPEDISHHDLHEKIYELNVSDDVSAILLEMPLPMHLDARAVQAEIAPDKDVEAVHPENLGRLFYGNWITGPCTAMAVYELLKRTCSVAGKEAVVVGHSEIFGKPEAVMLLNSIDAAPTVTVCHVATRDLASHMRRAEVLIVATGARQARWLRYRKALDEGERPDPPDLSPLVGADMVREGAVVIDVGINRIPRSLDPDGRPARKEDGKVDMVTVGDVDFDAVCEKASAITPVPGGVGPVTVAMLLRNTVVCAKAVGWALGHH